MIWLLLAVLAVPLILWITRHAFENLLASLRGIDASLSVVVGESRSIVAALGQAGALAETQELTGAVPGLVRRYVGELTPLL